MAKTGIELMMGLKEGNASAFDIICERYQKRLVGVAYRYIGNLADAEDLAAETFLSVWKSRHSYQPKSKFSVYIFTILKNKIKDYGRKHKESALNPEIELLDKKLSDLECKEIAEVKEKVLSKLTDDEQTLYRLKITEDKDYEEISKILGVPILTLRERWHRLLKKLTELLEPYL